MKMRDFMNIVEGDRLDENASFANHPYINYARMVIGRGEEIAIKELDRLEAKVRKALRVIGNTDNETYRILTSYIPTKITSDNYDEAMMTNALCTVQMVITKAQKSPAGEAGDTGQALRESSKPFSFNMAAMGIVPPSVVQAKTAEDQIDGLYAVADDPSTPKVKAERLLRLIKKLKDKMEARKTRVSEGAPIAPTKPLKPSEMTKEEPQAKDTEIDPVAAEAMDNDPDGKEALAYLKDKGVIS